MTARSRCIVAALIVLEFPLIGCHKFSIAAPPKPSTLKDGGYSLADYGVDYAAYKAAADKKDTDTATRLRNRITYGLMSDIDDSYGQFTKTLYEGKGAVAVSGDSIVLGLTAASTIATHTPTKTILSALGTAFTGVNLSVDKNLFAQQTYQTIAVAMQTRRDMARKFITDSLSHDDNQYPLQAAKRDLVAYFYAGTLPGGLQELQEEAGSAAKEQQKTPAAAIH